MNALRLYKIEFKLMNKRLYYIKTYYLTCPVLLNLKKHNFENKTF